MNIKPANLRNERQWRAMTGNSEQQFTILLELFIEAYQEVYGKSLKERLAPTRRGHCIESESDLLLFTLMSFKIGVSYDVLGVMAGMDIANVKRNRDTGLRVLKHLLKQRGHAPKREILTLEDVADCFGKDETLLIDATEQPIQRPSNPEDQKTHYSGKKKDIHVSISL